MLLVATTSCWQDRSGEYYALVGSKNWIYTTMQEYYLYTIRTCRKKAN